MKKHLLLSNLLLVFAICCSGQWTGGGTQVSFSADNHHRPFVSALPGGLGNYVTWVSTDTTANQKSSIRLNAFSPTGSLLNGWTSGGNVISATGDFYAPQLITSEDSSVIVAWYGYPDSASYTEIYVQKFSMSGAPLWNGGVPVQVTQDSDHVFEYPLIVSDKNKGVFIVYERFDSVIDPSSTDIFLQHIDNTGHVAAGWSATSAPVAVTPNVREYYPQLALTPDLSSVYVVYGQGLVGSTSLQLNKFNASNGTIASGWSAGGVTLSLGPDVYPDINHDLKLYTDNANNAVVFWIEARLTGNGEVYMQQTDPTGNTLLTPYGNLLGGDIASGNGIDYLEVTQDADDNFLVAFNNLVNFNDVSAMRVQPNGGVLWNDTLVTTGGYSAYPLPVSDGKRGMYLFYENTNTPQKLYAYGLDSMGNKYATWSLPGSSFGDLSTYDVFEPNYDFNATGTDSSKAVVAWARLMPDGLFGLFTCNLLPDGSVCTDQPFVASASGNSTGCSGTTDTVRVTASGGNAPYSYSWQVIAGDSLSCHTCQTTTFVGTQNSTFVVTITDADMYHVNDTLHFAVSGGALQISSLGTDTLCYGGSVALTVNGGGPANYQWVVDGRTIIPDSNQVSITATFAGIYEVITGGAGHCPDTSNTIVVSVNPLPIVYFPTGAADTVCSSGSPLTLSGGSPAGGVYSGLGVSSDSIFNPNGLQPGIYDVTYTFTGPNGCSNTAMEPVLVETCTGINTLQADNDIVLYPNPATDYVTLEIASFTGQRIIPAVYDIAGNEVNVSYRIDAGKITLHTAQLAEGIYLVKLNVNGASYVKRLIKVG